MADEGNRVSPDRRHSLSGRKNLDWFFANRKWVRNTGNSVVEAAWATRDLPQDEAALRFLFLAAKRSYKLAHDRNQIKRWLRAAVTEASGFAELEQVMAERGQQVLLMLRIAQPIPEMSWELILKEVVSVVLQISKRSITASAPPTGRAMTLVKKKDRGPLPEIQS